MNRHIRMFLPAMSLFAATTFASPAHGTDRMALIELEGGLRERPHPLAWLLGPDAGMTTRELLGVFEEASDDQYDGVIVRIKDIAYTRSQIEEIRRAMERVREAGQEIYVFSDWYGPAEYAIAGAADNVVLQSGGIVSLPGLYAEEMYFAGTLEWLGIKADYVQVGDFKGASEPMTRTGPSPEWSANMDALLDDLYDQSLEQIMTSREMTRDDVERAMGASLMLEGDDALEMGMVDAVIDIRDFTEYIEERQGDDIRLRRLGSGAEEMNIFAMWQALMQGSGPKTKFTKPTVAVLHINGPIVDGESSFGGMFGGESVGSRTIREALKTIENEDMIQAVVVRIDSPGGSAMASEVMWQGLQRLHGDKPVYVSVGSMAASGGYYCAVGGEKIFVNESSIVGSIGVVGGKLVMGGLYDKIHLGVHPRSRGPFAGMMSSVDAFSPAHRAKIRQMMEQTYDQFAGHVETARDGIDLDVVGEGRLFTGRQAVDLKMADGIAGLPETIELAAAAADLPVGTYNIVDFPEQEGLDSLFSGMMTMQSPGAALPLAEGLRQIIGEAHWPMVRDSLEAMMQLRSHPVLLVSPRALIVY
jgi:protease-4